MSSCCGLVITARCAPAGICTSGVTEPSLPSAAHQAASSASGCSTPALTTTSMRGFPRPSSLPECASCSACRRGSGNSRQSGSNPHPAPPPQGGRATLRSGRESDPPGGPRNEQEQNDDTDEERADARAQRRETRGIQHNAGG